ncbi:tyrosine-type recombinase/integrase, partial [Pseudochrobactrum sp. sp1633]|uniref:tyrosine-type recombinase/integrase n=1 Tax=Pseudochrobactrum sp. sp1633 TaxID=3036706 RepID=UPI0025A66D85
ATIYARLMTLKAFFIWLAGQHGYRSKISYSDADYFNPSAHDSRIAAARREKRVPTLEQVNHVITSMPSSTDVELRDKALVAFTLLTGARDSAIASMKLKHINLNDHSVFQDAREVATKNRKTFTSYFFPVGDNISQILNEWVKHLQTVLLFGPDDPLFPSTQVTRNSDGLFAPSGVNRNHWRSAAPIRRIFKRAFENAKLPYANPHSLRSTLTQFGARTCQNPEEFKAWSQNLGHEEVLTTFTSYGVVAGSRQSEIILGLANRSSDSKNDNNDRLSHIEAMLAQITNAQNQPQTPL